MNKSGGGGGAPRLPQYRGLSGGRRRGCCRGRRHHKGAAALPRWILQKQFPYRGRSHPIVINHEFSGNDASIPSRMRLWWS